MPVLLGNARFETVGFGNWHRTDSRLATFLACRWHWFVHSTELSTIYCHGEKLPFVGQED
jgi:hypothetical protein